MLNYVNWFFGGMKLPFECVNGRRLRAILMRVNNIRGFGPRSIHYQNFQTNRNCQKMPVIILLLPFLAERLPNPIPAGWL